MGITERQKEILNRVVEDYIGLAQPISSEFLEKKHKFGLSPATIRIEMQKLTEKGYLYQPYTSAGRIPTDRGYRFFVDELLEKGLEDFEIGNWVDEEIEEITKFIQSSEQSDRWKKMNILRLLAKKLASLSRVLVLSYLQKEKIFWKEGWEEILKEPEFREKDCLMNFVEFLKDFERKIEDFTPTFEEVGSGINVYIGRENPFKKAKDFSIISSKCYLPGEEEVVFSLLGPKRMAYDRNIGLILSLNKLLENF